jgi:hypothetical protein
VELFPVEKGPETVGLGGGDAVSAVRVRFGRVVSFSCTLQRVQSGTDGSNPVPSSGESVSHTDRAAAGREPRL